MKKCLSLILVGLLLAGCAGQPQSPTEDTQIVQQGLYVQDHPLEQHTSGAVRVFALENDTYTDLLMMGSRVMPVTEAGEAVVLYGEEGVISAQGRLEGYRADGIGFAVDVKGAACYLPQSKEVVLLNPQLQQTNRIQLPEDIQGDPAISLASNEIFYCRNGEIRALNMENGIARLLKSHTVAEQTLTGCYYDGKVIRCQVTDQQGNKRQMYLSAETGLTLSEDADIYELQTYGDRHFIRRMDSWIDQSIVGNRSGESKLLLTQNMEFVTGALAMNGAVSYQRQTDGLLLSYHDLEQGMTTAQVVLPKIQAPTAIAADQKYVWILAQELQDGQGGGQCLLRWDVTGSQLQEPVTVTTTLYTAQSPDEAGLKQCREQAKAFANTYGVKVDIWQDAVKTTGSYTAVPEHQPEILQDMLAKLEPALKLYPERFLRSTVKGGWIRICLVRSLSGENTWAQFWDRGDCYVLLSSQADMEAAMREAMGYAIDSRVLGNSRDYDTWNELNPEAFVYAAEADGQTQDVKPYLDGEGRAFVNEQAVTSANEDRRQLWIAAMTDGNEAVFAPQMMQAKLRRMCEGIREAYSLEKKTEVYPWEQYLLQPMVQE